MIEVIKSVQVQAMDSAKKQTTIYLDRDLLRAIRDQVNVGKESAGDYSASRFMDEAARMYLQAIKGRKSA